MHQTYKNVSTLVAYLITQRVIWTASVGRSVKEHFARNLNKQIQPQAIQGRK